MMLSQLSQIVEGSLTGADVPFESVSIDSRTLTSGALFVALKGPNFDGHNYISTPASRVPQRHWFHKTIRRIACRQSSRYSPCSRYPGCQLAI